MKFLARFAIGFGFIFLVTLVTVLMGKTLNDLGALLIVLMVLGFWGVPSMLFKLLGWFQDPEESEESKQRSKGAW